MGLRLVAIASGLIVLSLAIFLSTKVKRSLLGTQFIESRPKKTRQGSGQHTKYAASSRNGKPKRYRGQGR